MQSGYLLFICLTLISICYGNERCLKLVGVTESELESIPKKAILETLPLKLKCFIKCLMDDLLGADGKIDMSRVVEEENMERRRNKIEKCKVRFDPFIINNHTEACEYAVKVLQCLRSTE